MREIVRRAPTTNEGRDPLRFSPTPSVAATQFTAYMALLNLSYTAGNTMSPWLEPLGVRPVYLLAAVVQISVLLVLPFCRPSRPEDQTIARPTGR